MTRVHLGRALQAGGVPRRPGEGSDRRDGGAEEPHRPDGEGGELPPDGAGGPEGGQHPLPQQYHEEPGGTPEGTARPEGETAQGSSPPMFFGMFALCVLDVCLIHRNACSLDVFSSCKSAPKCL